MDSCLAVSNTYLPILQALSLHPKQALDAFYLAKKQNGSNPVKELADEIIRLKGNCAIETIYKTERKISLRQTERLFKKHIGLSPKQFCKIVRYNYARRLMYEKNSVETLLSIALRAGYYDHAHFSKEFKKIAGCVPSVSGSLIKDEKECECRFCTNQIFY